VFSVPGQWGGFEFLRDAIGTPQELWAMVAASLQGRENAIAFGMPIQHCNADEASSEGPPANAKVPLASDTHKTTLQEVMTLSP
jgi:hypothetical protein